METTLEMVFAQAQQLSPQDRLRLMARLAENLEADMAHAQTNWHQALREAYGILKDDPIERPPQPPVKEIDGIE